MELTEVMKLYVNNESAVIDYDKDLLQLAIEQSLQTLLYPISKAPEYKKYYISWVVKQESFYEIQKELTHLFNENQIPHVYFKGSVLSKLYRDPAVRTRGDVDIFVNPTDFAKAKDILLSNGYVPEDGDPGMHHVGLTKNGIEIELHFSMMEEGNVDKSWLTMFKDPFKHCCVEEGYLYRFKDTYHFQFCLMHYAHHLRSGAGLRYLLDFHYMFLKTNIDLDLLHGLLGETNLTLLYNNVINAMRTVLGFDHDSSIPVKDVKFMIDYMASYGIHGHSNNETDVRTSGHKHKFRFFIARVFLTNKLYREARFPKMGKHLILYPVMLIVHWVWLITHRMKSFVKFAFGKNENKKLYKDLGV